MGRPSGVMRFSGKPYRYPVPTGPLILEYGVMAGRTKGVHFQLPLCRIELVERQPVPFTVGWLDHGGGPLWTGPAYGLRSAASAISARMPSLALGGTPPIALWTSRPGKCPVDSFQARSWLLRSAPRHGRPIFPLKPHRLHDPGCPTWAMCHKSMLRP